MSAGHNAAGSDHHAKVSLVTGNVCIKFITSNASKSCKKSFLFMFIRFFLNRGVGSSNNGNDLYAHHYCVNYSILSFLILITGGWAKNCQAASAKSGVILPS